MRVAVRSGLKARFAASLLATATGVVASVALIQGAQAQGAQATDRTAQAVGEARPRSAAVSAKPWAELTADQKAALLPLQRDWGSIDGVRQQKWIELAGRLPTMPAQEQTRIKQRMAQWASLTPAKRNQVRLQFLDAQQMPLEQRQARWQEYQALSADEKRALARQARQSAPAAGAVLAPDERTNPRAQGELETKPAPGKNNLVEAPAPPVTRAATATSLQAKPGATTRPLTTPAAPPAHHQTGLPKIVATDGFVDPATMLPKRGPQGAAVRSSLTAAPATKP